MKRDEKHCEQCGRELNMSESARGLCDECFDEQIVWPEEEND